MKLLHENWLLDAGYWMLDTGLTMYSVEFITIIRAKGHIIPETSDYRLVSRNQYPASWSITGGPF